MKSLNDFFEISTRGSTIRREVRGAIATFLTMAYIIFVNPGILASAGVPQGSAITCTAAAAGVCCILMGMFANFPIALASGMGLNAVVAFTIARTTGSWQTAMGLVFLDGILILILVLIGLREAVLRAIPHDLRMAIGAGIGLFIAFIGLVNAKLVIGSGVANAPLTFGSVHNPEAWVAMVGLVVTAVLMAWRVTGAILLGIIVATAAAVFWNVANIPDGFSPVQRPDFSNAFQLDIRAALNWSYAPLLLSIMMVDFFDTLGTASAIADEAKLQDAGGNIPRLRRILMVDSISASIGGLFGASSVTSYIESASGVAEGARTGLHTVIVGIFFLCAIFVAPIVGLVPAAATAPALILVGFLMLAQLGKINFDDLDTAIPAFVILLTIPLTYSIAHGIGYGFVMFVLIKLVRLRPFQVHPLMYVTAATFVAYFVWG